MNNELLRVIKEHTDTLVQQTKTSPQETLEFKMNTQLKTFAFNPSINLVEEGKWLLAVTSFEATNSVYIITDENNSFSIITPGHWSSQNSEETVNELNNLLDLRSKNDLDLHIKEVNKRGNIIILDGQEYIYYNINKYDFIELLKKNKYADLEDMVYRLELTYNEIIDILDIKYIPTSTKGYTCLLYTSPSPRDS